VKRAFALTGIAPLAHHYVDTLSGGQLQRVWFASALAQNTSILLLDEPTNHLDLRYQVEILQLMRQLADAHSITVGVVLHDLNHAAAVADTVLVLDQGQVVAEGPPHLAFTSDLLTTVYDIDVIVTHTTPTTVTVSTPTTLTLRAQPRAHTNQPAPVC
jgi:iron complex transport system ATP-binding protein